MPAQLLRGWGALQGESLQDEPRLRIQQSCGAPAFGSAHQREQNRYNFNGERDRSSIYRRLNYESVSIHGKPSRTHNCEGRKNCEKKHKKGTKPTKHTFHLLYLLVFLHLKKRSTKNKKIPQTHERHETHETRILKSSLQRRDARGAGRASGRSPAYRLICQVRRARDLRSSAAQASLRTPFRNDTYLLLTRSSISFTAFSNPTRTARATMACPMENS